MIGGWCADIHVWVLYVCRQVGRQTGSRPGMRTHLHSFIRCIHYMHCMGYIAVTLHTLHHILYIMSSWAYYSASCYTPLKHKCRSSCAYTHTYHTYHAGKHTYVSTWKNQCIHAYTHPSIAPMELCTRMTTLMPGFQLAELLGLCATWAVHLSWTLKLSASRAAAT